MCVLVGSKVSSVIFTTGLERLKMLIAQDQEASCLLVLFFMDENTVDVSM